MRRMILPLILFVFAACQPATMELTDAERATIAEEVTAIHTQFWSEWEQVNVEEGMAFYRTDAAWGMNGEIRFGMDNIRVWFEPALVGIARQEITFDDRRVMVLDRDVAYVMERGSFLAFDGAGVEVMSGTFAASVVWVRSNGEWKVAGGHESMPVPAPEAASMQSVA